MIAFAIDAWNGNPEAYPSLARAILMGIAALNPSYG
jgi:hypothetical protein